MLVDIIPNKKIEWIKIVKHILDLGLHEAKDAVDVVFSAQVGLEVDASELLIASRVVALELHGEIWEKLDFYLSYPHKDHLRFWLMVLKYTGGF